MAERSVLRELGDEAVVRIQLGLGTSEGSIFGFDATLERALRIVSHDRSRGD